MKHFKRIPKAWDYNSYKQIYIKYIFYVHIYINKYIYNLPVPTTTLLIITVENYY